MTYTLKCDEAGWMTLRTGVEDLEALKEQVIERETQHKADGIYTQKFYKIIDEETLEVIRYTDE